MNALDIADILWETGVMLGLSNGSKSRSQAYLKTAQLIEDLGERWQDLATLDPENWASLPEEVHEAFETLKNAEPLALYEELKEALGEHAPDLLRVRGIGPSMARSIQQTLDIWTLDKLEEAANDGRLLKVRGIGQKVLEQLQMQIEITKETLAERRKRRVKDAQKSRLKTQIAQVLHQKDAPSATPAPKASSAAPASSATAAPVATTQTEPSGPQSTSAQAGSPPRETSSAAPPKVAAPARENEVVASKDDTSIVRHPIGDVLCSPRSGKTGFQQDGNSVVIPGTPEQYPIKTGVIDLLMSEESSTNTLSQRIMESELYSRFYEGIFRPGLTRIVTKRTLAKDIALSIQMLRLRSHWGVLDVACGTGNYARAIAQQLDPTRGFVIALDVSWSMLRRASTLRKQEGLRHMHLVRGDALSLPIADEILEAVHCTAGFHLFSDPRKALYEFNRVTRPGGRLVIGTFVESRRYLPVRLIQKYSAPITGFHWFNRDELESLIKSAGYIIQDIDVDGLAISISAQKR